MMKAEFAPLQDISAIEGMLPKISLFGGIAPEQLQHLTPYLEAADVPTGVCLVQLGEEPSNIYIIEKGCVELRLVGQQHELCKRQFSAGDHIGEVAMLSLINNTASFYTVDDCRLLALSRKSLARLHRELPEVFGQLILNIARDLARKLQYSDEIMLCPESPQDA